MVVLEIVLDTVLAMGAGVLVGAAVQRATHFIDPIDPVTALLALAVPVMTVYQSGLGGCLPFDAVWSWPFLAGYLSGYLVSGHTKYTMVRRFTAAKTTYAEPWVVYQHGEGTYIQEQTWWPLFKRCVLGIRHELICTNGDLEPDWTDCAKWPHMPKRRHEEIMLDTVESYDSADRTGKHPRLHLSRPVTVVSRSNGSVLGTVDLVRDAKTLTKANKQLIEVQSENFQLKQSLNIKLADSVAFFMTRIYSKAPGAAFLATLRDLGDHSQDKTDSRQPEQPAQKEERKDVEH